MAALEAAPINPKPISIRTPLMSLLMREMMAPVGFVRKKLRCSPVRCVSKRFFRSYSTRRPGMKKNNREPVRVNMIPTAKARIQAMRLRNCRPEGSGLSARMSTASCRYPGMARVIHNVAPNIASPAR